MVRNDLKDISYIISTSRVPFLGRKYSSRTRHIRDLTRTFYSGPGYLGLLTQKHGISMGISIFADLSYFTTQELFPLEFL